MKEKRRQCPDYILCQKRTEDLCAITLKNEANFEEELTCALKNDMRNLANFDWTFESLKTSTLIGSFWSKYIMFELENYRGVTSHDTERLCNIKRKIPGCLKNDIRNLINFHARSCESENLQFDAVVLLKAYKVLDEKVQKSYVSWHWRVIQRKTNS